MHVSKCFLIVAILHINWKKTQRNGYLSINLGNKNMMEEKSWKKTVIKGLVIFLIELYTAFKEYFLCKLIVLKKVVQY